MLRRGDRNRMDLPPWEGGREGGREY